MGSLFLEPITFGEAESADSGATGFRADGRNFEKIVSETPFHDCNLTKRGLGRTLAPPALAARSQFLLRLYVRERGTESKREPVFERCGGPGEAGRKLMMVETDEAGREGGRCRTRLASALPL